MKFMKNVKLAVIHALRDAKPLSLLAFMYFMGFMVKLASRQEKTMRR